MKRFTWSCSRTFSSGIRFSSKSLTHPVSVLFLNDGPRRPLPVRKKAMLQNMYLLYYTNVLYEDYIIKYGRKSCFSLIQTTYWPKFCTAEKKIENGDATHVRLVFLSTHEPCPPGATGGFQSRRVRAAGQRSGPTRVDFCALMRHPPG